MIVRNGISDPLRQDVPAMCEIFTSGQIHHHQMFPDIFCKPDDEDKIRAYVESFLKPRNRFRTRRRFARALFNDDILEGYMLYQLHKSSDVFFGNDRWFAHIDDIAIGEKFRKNGAASKLMNTLIEEVDGLGGGIVSGQVWEGNESSENLFKKADFQSAAKQFYRVL